MLTKLRNTCFSVFNLAPPFAAVAKEKKKKKKKKKEEEYGECERLLRNEINGNKPNVGIIALKTVQWTRCIVFPILNGTLEYFCLPSDTIELGGRAGRGGGKQGWWWWWWYWGRGALAWGVVFDDESLTMIMMK